MRSLACVLFLACAQLAAAQSYPAKPLRLIVGYSAGGGADALDLREDLAALHVHATRFSGGVADLPHDFTIDRG
jgi:hypothetical protein